MGWNALDSGGDASGKRRRLKRENAADWTKMDYRGGGGRTGGSRERLIAYEKLGERRQLRGMQRTPRIDSFAIKQEEEPEE